jgi:hypothetical protein
MGTRQEPGTWQTHVVVWHEDDRSKAGDPRFWWSAEDVGRTLRVAPPELASRLAKAGTPKGVTLARLRRESGGDEFELRMGGVPDDYWPRDKPPLVHPERIVRFSLAHWRDADPAKTRFIISHTWRPTPEEQEAMSREPREGDDLREAWVAAWAEGDEETAAALQEQMEEELGAVPFSKLSVWDPQRSVEIAPGVLVQDERPAGVR